MILVLGLFSLSPVGARGQGPASEGPYVLTLADALERAARHRPAYRIARNRVGLSAPARRAAWAAFLPSLSMSAGTSLTLNRRRISEDFFGRPVENAINEWETTSSSSQGIRGGIVLFEGARRFHALEATGAEAESLDAAARSVRISVEAEVARRHLEAMRRRELLELETELLGARRRDREEAERRYGLAGVGPRLLLTARERLVAQRIAVLRARAALQKARAALRRAVADPTLGSFVLPARPSETNSPPDRDARAVVARALEANPEVRKERAAARAARARARAAGGVRWPRLELGIEFTQNTFSRDRAALFDPFPDEGRFARAGITVGGPLFGGLRTGDRRARAEVEAANAEERLRRVRLDLEVRVRGRLVDLRSAHELLHLVRRVRNLAEARLDLAREEYRLGIRAFSDLQPEIEAATVARRAAIDAEFRLRTAEVDLREAVGSP